MKQHNQKLIPSHEHDVFITFGRQTPQHEAAQPNTNNLVMNHDKTLA
jgi:hypothetical protein